MMRIILLALLVICGQVAAEAALDAGEDFQPSDVLYAPENVSPSASNQGLQARYYSQARLLASDFGHAGRILDGAELFIDGQFVGNSPVTLNGYFIDKPTVTLSARMRGYGEESRMNLILPAQGDARVYLMGDNAANWFTTPSFVVGILSMGASLLAYSQNRPGSGNVGLSLVVGGAAVIAISQAISHFIYLPGLKKQMNKKNSEAEAMP